MLQVYDLYNQCDAFNTLSSNCTVVHFIVKHYRNKAWSYCGE